MTMTAAAGAGELRRDGVALARPTRPRRRRSVRNRALLLAALGVTGVFLVEGIHRAREISAEGRRTLAERAELLTGIQATALSAPMWDFDVRQVQAILDALASDPDFAAGTVRDADGEVVAQRVSGVGGTGALLRMRQPIHYIQDDEHRLLGALELDLSTDRLADALERDLRQRIIVGIVSLALLLGLVLVAFRQVTRPLDLLTRVVGRLASGDHGVTVPGCERRDEIGDVARAINTFKENAVALLRAEEKFRAIYENTALGIYRATVDGQLVSANPALLRIMGRSDGRGPGDGPGAPATGGATWYVEPERRAEFFRSLWERDLIVGFVSQVYRHDGSTAWVSETARVVRGLDGEALFYEGTVEDITVRKQLEDDERLRVRAAVESAVDAIVITDTGGRPVYINPAFGGLIGHDLEALTRFGGVPGLAADRRLGREIATAIAESRRWNGEVRLATAAGGTVTVAIRASTIGASRGSALGTVLILTDVSERHEAEARIRHMAHHDALTGLPNRVLFNERLEAALAQSRRQAASGAVFCMDLDRFKEVNDTLGHAAGDDLLRTVAERLGAAVREVDTIARLGGDEFAIVGSAPCLREDAEALCRRLVETLAQPFEILGQEVRVGASVGVALFPAHGEVPEQLLRCADLALYRAKAEGRSTYRVFDEEMDVHRQARWSLERQLRRALAADQLELHYQPQVALGSGEIIGAEALLRWNQPERGWISPAEFIPLAEETGMIRAIGEWVLRTACEEAAGWPGDLQVAVNLSPLQFRQLNLTEIVRDILDASGLTPSRLELEITEGVLLQDTELTLTTLRDLKAIGVKIAIDDFGTGYSSLSYLRRFPFDKIKVDQSFVRELGRDRDSAAIVRAIIGLSRGLGMRANAEGVETPEQADLLRAEGCAEVQGFHFGRPMPAPVFLALAGRGGLTPPA